MIRRVAWTTLLFAAVSMPTSARADEATGLAKHLTFLATFDESTQADFAKGDAASYIGEEIPPKNSQPGLPAHITHVAGQGKWGGSLQFKDVSPKVFFYRGKDNVPYSAEGFDLTVSYWLRLTPEKDLKPGYVDPLQITDKAWNNASIFCDFNDKGEPRLFRLGVMSDLTFWNPQNTDWEKIPDSDRPLIVVQQHPFRADEWTHVAFTLKGVNRSTPCVSTFYLNGKAQGSRTVREKFTWNPEQVAIMLGIQYIGGMDELSVFDKALTAEEIVGLMKLEGGVKSLRK